MSIYDFKITDSDGEEISMEEYRGKVLLIVNTASKCGFTPQYKELQNLYDQFHERGLDVLAFPCNQFANQEPGTNDEIQSFCAINYGVTFNVMSKIDVNGPNTHPLYKYIKDNSPGLLGKSIKWNFTKFLVDAEGNIVERYSPMTSPEKIKPQIEKLLCTQREA